MLNRLIINKLPLVITLFFFVCSAAQKSRQAVKGSNDVFDAYRVKWENMITGGNLIDMTDTVIAAKVHAVTEAAQSDWNKLNKLKTRTCIWSDIEDTTKEGNVTTAYRRLANMALAYKMKGSFLKGNKQLLSDVISALEWEYVNRYNENSKQFGNWYIWEIGAPEQLNNLLMLLYDEIPEVQLAKYVRAENAQEVSPLKINYLNYKGVRGNPSTGGNLAHKATQFMNQAVLLNDLAAYTSAKNAFSTAYNDWVAGGESEGDGFHGDGTFIQHYSVFYNGGYEVALIEKTCLLLLVISGTTLDFDNNFKAKVYDKVEKTFIPLIYKGQAMDLARGRFLISATGHSIARDMTECLLKLSESAPASIAARFKAFSKFYIESNTYYPFLSNCDLQSYLIAKKLKDESISAKSNYNNLNIFTYGAKAALIRPEFGFGINMVSKNASPYESINGENLKGWYTGFGMTYLYNSDFAYYADGLWPTINPYRLPGTTVTTEKRSDAAYGWRFKNTQSWVGGATINSTYGSIGMQLEGYPDKNGLPLTGKKSWFIFDDEIVALGTDISAGLNTTAETIIENRKLNNSNNNTITVNGEVKSNSLSGNVTTLKAVNSVHISGNTAGADIGYYLPVSNDVNFIREARISTERSIDLHGSTLPITKNYATLWINHTSGGGNNTYQYAILPNKTSAQTTAYSRNPDIQVIENSAEAQAVLEKKLQITGINFWNDKIKTSGGITCNKKAAVIMKSAPGRLAISVADPTMENQGIITIEINQSAQSLISSDSRIEVIQLNPHLKFNVNVKDAQCKSVEAVFAIIKK